ncbi:MAG: cysteine desulfurase [Hyphomicrobiales bacterium]|nr:cysteine desulfurase [Hyphomicrobiales bacterium]MCP4998956.1 cysteine desulfurase [Hyphomicrobiales bacterium]
MIKSRIYMDFNATAPLLPVARAAMLEAMDLTGNPSSVHSEGRSTRAVIDSARRLVAEMCGSETSAVVFTSGATESAATVLTPDYKMGKSDLRVGHLYVCAVEHPCMLSGGRFDADQVSTVNVDSSGIIDLDDLGNQLHSHQQTDGPAMVAIQLANNETGIIQPVADAAALVRDQGGILVVDAVQAAGRLPIDMAALGADFLLLSSHKIGGPKGAGAIVGVGEVMMPTPLIPGGGQEKGHRSGTENPAAIAGFGAAAAFASTNLEARAADIKQLRDALETGISGIAPDCLIYGADVPRLVNTTFFSLPGLKAETAQIAFDLEGVAVSAGSACSSGKVGPSHVLKAMGQDVDPGGIRVSIGAQTTEADIDRFLEVFTKIDGKREKKRQENGALV